MNLIGYWMTDLREAELPLPLELVGPMEAGVRERVCDYLLEGHVLRAMAGHSWCRFRCGIANHRMGSCELTDGEWLWPEGLVHYVRDHGVLLPEAFVARALSGQELKMPEEERPVSLEFWLRWVEEWRRRQARHWLVRVLDARGKRACRCVSLRHSAGGLALA